MMAAWKREGRQAGGRGGIGAAGVNLVAPLRCLVAMGRGGGREGKSCRCRRFPVPLSLSYGQARGIVKRRNLSP